MPRERPDVDKTLLLWDGICIANPTPPPPKKNQDNVTPSLSPSFFCVLFCFCQGDTLGEVKPGDEEVVSAADWVNRSRKKAVAMEEERLLARQRARCVPTI